MLVLNYNIEEPLECEPRVKECCEPEKKPGEPPTSGDCCYEIWMEEFKVINAQYTRAEKTVIHLENRLTHLQTQRDMWKTWKDELDKACDYSDKICQQLEIILHHTSRISRNNWLTKRAIHLLFCMLRDFYMQVDLLKKKYDYLITCIKSQKNPALADGLGIMVLIEDYGKKLDAVILTRDGLIQLIISAISTVNNINKSIGHHGHNYGLHAVLHEWKNAFNCDGNYSRDDDDDDDDDDDNRRRYNQNRDNRNRDNRNREENPEDQFADLDLEPSFRFPICDSRYYNKISRRYEYDNREYNELASQITEETKRRDNLKALRDGLTAVINDPDVDPSKRCGK